MGQVIDTNVLREVFLGELLSRRVGGDGYRYCNLKGGKEALYGTAAAVNIYGTFGVSLGDATERSRWADAVLSYQGPDGEFDEGEGRGHALCMVLQALNLLAVRIPSKLGPLAPRDVAELGRWLDAHDWSSTHKELWGQTAPLLASGLVDQEWTSVLVEGISARLCPENPLATWCAEDDPPWRVISCVYHVLELFDAARISYPYPGLLLQRLLNLDWDRVADAQERTTCIDGDWAWVLMELGKLEPGYFPEVMRRIRRVSTRRAIEWHEERERILAQSTHDLYCYLWVTAAFQQCVREHFCGPYIRDTLNDPSLLRLQME